LCAHDLRKFGLCTAVPVEELDDQAKQDIIERQAACAQAQKRFTTANRMRGKKHPNTAKLATDKDGKRYVVDPDDDLLAGGTQAPEAGC
jgi:hypothetical protein